MRASPIRSLVLAALFSLPLLADPLAAQSRVSFPSDPKTVAECDGPALHMRELQDQLAARQRQIYKDTETADHATGGERYRALMDLLKVQGAEGDKLRQEHRALEQACRTAARKNEQLVQQALRELKEGYAKAKRAYDQAKAIIERIQNSPADAYVKRNESHSPALESQMNTAKQYILDFQPKAEIVSAIQDASFFQLKSEVQQLNGDITALESAIQSIRSDNTASAPPDPKPDLASKPDTTASSTGINATEIAESLQRGVDQAVGWLSSVFSGNPRPSTGGSSDSTGSSPSPADPPAQPAYSPAAAPPPRALTASEQCAATAQSCNSGCMGVAALGLLSLFTRNNAAATEAGNQTQLCSNRCDEAQNSCQQQASGQPGTNQPGGSVVSAGNARGLPVAECHRQANASGLGEKLNALPRNDNVLMLRGTIYNLDFLIKTYTQCLPDQETQNAINGWKTQREASLRTCRQISSSDNCLVSPFGATASATPVRASAGSSAGSAPVEKPTHRNRCGGTIPLPASYRCGGGGGIAIN